MNSEKQNGNKPDPSAEPKYWGWIFQIGIWACIGITILSIVKGYDTILNYCGIVGIPLYVTYIFHSLLSTSFCSLLKMQPSQSIHRRLEELYVAPPKITFNVNCFHTQTSTCVNSNGQTERRTDIINTWSDAQSFSYYSWKDISGVCLLDSDHFGKSKIFIKLELELQIEFADPLTEEDFQKERWKFFHENEKRDELMDFREIRTVEGFEKFNLVRISDSSVWCMCWGMYLFFTILPFIQLYRLYLNSRWHHCAYTIKKIVSNRYNLNSPEYNEKYASSIPQLVIFDQKYEYHGGSVFQENQPKLPTEKEGSEELTNSDLSQGLDEILLVKKK